MKAVIVLLIFFTFIFSCDLNLWEANLKYVIEGSGVANISYTHPMGWIETDTVNLPWQAIFQNDQLIANSYTLISDNGHLYIYHDGEIMAEGTSSITWNK